MASIAENGPVVKPEFDVQSQFHDILAAGVSLVPVGDDKHPTVKWKQYQKKAASVKLLNHWLADHTAFALVCGKVSGGVEIIDIDNNLDAQPQPYTADEFFDAWRNDPHVAGIFERYNLPVQRTGGGGYQIAYRCPEPSGNEKLAWIPDATKEHGRAVAIETRGEGGYAVIAPSVLAPGRRYALLQGSFASIPIITQEERNALLAAARRFCLMPYTNQEITAAKKSKAQSRNGTASVIDAYNAAHNVKDLLIQSGYTEAGHGGRLVRPGGTSGSVHVLDADNVAFPWSSNDPLHRTNGTGRPSPVDPFDVYAFYKHGGDTKAAVREAAQLLGMDRKPTERTLKPTVGDNAYAATT